MTQSNRTSIYISFCFVVSSASSSYVSSSQILIRSLSIGSTSYQDSPITSQVESSFLKQEQTENTDSNVSSPASMTNKKPIPSRLSAHSKTEETIDTAPFTIDSPTQSSNFGIKPHPNEHNKQKETDDNLKPSSSTTSEADPEEKIIYDE